jgi:hypothetical protein
MRTALARPRVVKDFVKDSNHVEELVPPVRRVPARLQPNGGYGVTPVTPRQRWLV